MLRLLLQKIIKMIKKNFLILILLLVPLHSYANQNYFSLRDDVSCLKGNFEGAQNKVKESELMFFDCFPKDFRKYAMIFGLGGGGVDNNYGKLYNESYDYVMLYFEISKKYKKYSSIFSIAINGHWEADAVNVYQHELKEFISDNPKVSYDELSRFDDKNLFSFWFFYFDGPIHPKALPREILNINDSSKRIATSAQYLVDYFNKEN